MNRFTFSPNVPQLIALADPQGDYNSDQEQVEYPLADGRILVLNTSEATRLNMLDLQIGETFWITKRVTPGQVPYIEMTLSPAVPVRKRARVRAMPATQPPEQPRLFDRKGTGTYGPAPEMQPAPLRRPAQPIPFNRAFVEVVKIVRDGLKEAGVQWGDGPQQDACSTLLIGALNREWIGPWEAPDVV